MIRQIEEQSDLVKLVMAILPLFLLVIAARMGKCYRIIKPSAFWDLSACSRQCVLGRINCTDWPWL